MIFTVERTVRFENVIRQVFCTIQFILTGHETMEIWFEEALHVPYRDALQTHGFPSKTATFQYHSPCRNGEDSYVGLRSLSEGLMRLT